MEGQVAWRRPRVKCAEWRLVGYQLARVRVELIDHHLVDALVCDEDMSARQIEGDVVRVRPFLGRPRPRAVVLDEVGRGAKPPLGVDRQDDNTAVLMIGDKHPASSRIAAQVAGLAAEAGLPTQLGQTAVRPVDLERDRPAAVEAHTLADGEQEPALWVEGQERRIDLRRGVQECELPSLRILTEGVNTFGSA